MSERVEAGPAVTARGRHGVSTDLMMLLAITIWGVNFTAVKVALRSMEPLAFNAVRFTLATVVTFVVLAWQARATGRPELTRAPARRDFLVIALISFMGNSVYQVLFIQGMARTSPGNASLIMATAPIWVAILGFLLRIERINRLMFGGILLSFAGIVLLVMGGGKPSHSSSSPSPTCKNRIGPRWNQLPGRRCSIPQCFRSQSGTSSGTPASSASATRAPPSTRT